MTDRKNQIGEFLEEFSRWLPELDAETRGIQLFGAPGLNVFSLLNTNERRVARVIADLLNPKGFHGQGNLFLNWFMKAIGLQPPKKGEHVDVTLEDPTKKGRFIDITVNTESVILGIEVKLWAAQQDNQLKDYFEDLKSRVRCNQQWCLVFLANQTPKTAENEVVRMPWLTLVENKKQERTTIPFMEILKNSLPEVRAPRTRAFLEDFMDWIGNTFGGAVMDNGEYSSYIKAVQQEFEDKENRRAIGAIILAHNELHATIINSVGEAILTLLKKGVAKDFESNDDANLAIGLKEKGWKLHRPHWPVNLFLVIEAEKDDFNVINFGIYAPDGNRIKGGDDVKICEKRNEIDFAIKKHESIQGKGTEYYAWYEKAESNQWDTRFAGRLILEAPDGNIAEHPEIKLIINRLISLAQIIDQAFPPPITPNKLST